MTPRKSLSDILHNGDRQNIAQVWDSTEAAEDFGSPLPAGEYVCHVVSCDLFNSHTKGTPGVKLSFRVIEGDHASRIFWHDIWLTPAALPMAKRDLAKLGVIRLEQLEKPLPPGIRCKVKLAHRCDDNGAEFNRVRSFEVIGIDPPEEDAFAPIDTPQPSPQPLVAANVAGGDDDTFDPRALENEGGGQ